MKRPNIIIIVLDGLRADRLAAYGGDPRLMPRLNALAEAGSVYRRHYTVANTSLPSHVSLFTGALPSYHACASHYSYYDGRAGYLPDLLRAEGYRTIGIMNKSPYLSRDVGLIRGFDEFYSLQKCARYRHQRNRVKNLQIVHATSAAGARPGLAARLAAASSAALRRVRFLRDPRLRSHFRFSWYNDQGGRTNLETFERTLPRLAAEPERPFMLFVNISEPHMPFSPLRRYLDEQTIANVDYDVLHAVFCPRELRLEQIRLAPKALETVTAMADAKNRYADDLLHRMMRLLEQHGLRDDSRIFIMSDHGACLQEKKCMLGHENSIDNVEIRTPLIVLGDGFPARVVERNTSVIDLAPTILAQCGLQPTEHMIRNQATDLTAARAEREIVIAEMPRPPRKYRETYAAYPHYYLDLNTTRRAFHRHDHKLIWSADGRHELYDLGVDLTETRNLLPDQRDLALDMIRAATETYRRILGDRFFSLEVFDYTFAERITEEMIKTSQRKEDVHVVEDLTRGQDDWAGFFETLQE